MAFDLFKLAGSVFIDTEEANKSLSKTETNAQNFGSTLGKVAGGALAVGTAVVGTATAVTGALIDTTKEASETADNIDKMSQKIGISAEAYQEWDYILERNGANVDMLQTGLKTLSNAMDDANNGSSSAIDKFDRLGVSVQNADGSMKSAEQMFNDVVTALSNMPESAERTAMATDLLGKSATELAPMFNSGSQAIEDLRQNAHDLGLVMSDESVKAGANMQDMLTDLESSFGMLKTSLGSALMPIMTKLIEFVIDKMPKLQEMVAKFTPIAEEMFNIIIPILEQLIDELMPVFEEIMLTLEPLMMELVQELMPAIMELLQALLPHLVEIVKELAPVLVELLIALVPLIESLIPLLNPILDILVSIVSVSAKIISDILPPVIDLVTKLMNDVLVPLFKEVLTGLANAIDKVVDIIDADMLPIVDDCMQAWQGFLDFIVGIFTLDFEKAMQGLADFTNGIFNGIKDTINGTIDAIVEAINYIITEYNRQLGNVAGKIGLKSFVQIPTITRTLPMLEEGGTLTSAGSVLVGEKAPEILDLPAGARVRPLDNLGSISKADMTEAFKDALLSVGISLELSANSDALFDKVVKTNTEYRRRHNGASALA